MKLLRDAVVGLSATSLLATPAFAQGLAPHDTGPQPDSATHAGVFLRIPFGGDAREQAPRFGFALATGCLGSAGFTSQAGRDACDAQPLRSLELSSGFGDDAPWMLSFGGIGRRGDIASWSPQTGVLSFAGEGGSNDWVWISLGVAAGIGVAAALSGGDDDTICPDGFVAVPLGGGCQPIS